MSLSTTVHAQIYDTLHITAPSDRVYLREKPTTDSKSLGLYFPGTHATLLGEQGDWKYVMIGTEKGYMHKSLLTIGDVTHKARNATIIAKGTLNLRAWPSRHADVITRLPQGMQISVLGETPDQWCFVKAGDLYGYVMYEFIKTSGYVSTIPIPKTVPEELTGKWIFTSSSGELLTAMTIYPNGTFWGYHAIPQPEEKRQRYPNGTVYESHFTGHFAEPEKVNEHEYRMIVDIFQPFGIENTERIEYKTRYITIAPQGMTAESHFSLYLPGMPKNQLPAEAWFQYGQYDLTEADAFLYNHTLDTGFRME